ncbi:aspartate kinase [Pirellula staleyi DSM 6068]|uniref:aspartate kinase n=1 Tax=Pirellula staleyi (strain ATCC 27377 / DSM 6068 / ICPB 4128) TaxID=530564 RepID=D2R4Y9_PIRSD|nr:aspartate kinase [Pirellula staleyi]ADB18951.1 aspartate kinase [Pirellula staleyi DSM 6068]
MPLIVQKFGGSSVATPEKILKAARRAIRAQQEGNQVVMVVSAMGDTTDDLLELAAQVNERPPAREMDMLLSTGEQISVALMAMAIHSLGNKAISLTGAQIGVKTDASYRKARIKSIETSRMRKLLDEGNIVIAAGFQGIDEDFNITTLGRGGSDTTAVALAAVLRADACEIYTDVDGVYTTDPRVVPEARRVSRIGYDEMLELASLGAGVMHSRSIEFGKKFDVPIHVRSSFTDQPGTMIVAEPERPDMAVSGAAITKDEARITVEGIPDVPGTSLEIFKRIADRNISVDMIVQNVGESGKADVSFTVPRNELDAALEAVREGVRIVGAAGITSDDSVAKVSVVGLGMARQTGVAERMFRALAAAGINIQMITTSEIKISVLVRRDEAQKALRIVHQEFELDKEPTTPIEPWTPKSSQSDAADVIARLQGINMEDLTIDDIQLDSKQSRVTISGVPDAPGIAAKVFEQVAAGGVFVDMIVQSHPTSSGEATLSFTVPDEQLVKSVEVAKQVAKSLACKEVTSSPAIAKLSVSGVGLRTHTGVAIRMFKALSDAGINLEMINTSEVRVNVVVDGAAGERGMKQLQQAFSDVMR